MEGELTQKLSRKISEGCPHPFISGVHFSPQRSSSPVKSEKMGGGQGKAKALQQLKLKPQCPPWGHQVQIQSTGVAGPLELKRSCEQEQACHVAFLKPGTESNQKRPHTPGRCSRTEIHWGHSGYLDRVGGECLTGREAGAPQAAGGNKVQGFLPSLHKIQMAVSLLFSFAFPFSSFRSYL